MAGEEMPIFTRTFDLLSWLLPMSSEGRLRLYLYSPYR